MPQYFNLQDVAKAAAEKGVLGGIRSGLFTYSGYYKTWPPYLDGAQDGVDCATKALPCFSIVLGQDAISDGSWYKVDSTHYQGPLRNYTYTYTPDTGYFE